MDRFLKHLGEPVSEPQSERAVRHILDRLRCEGVRNPVRVLSTASPSRPARVPTWSAVTAAVVLLIAGALLHTALLQLGTTKTVTNSVRGDGRVLRAGENGSLLTLDDGSKVEMSPRAELSVVRLLGDLRVRLTSGTVLITAAKQKEGHHLFVETKDCVISVIGTVFQVNAERSGSRISVIEGEVHVQRGEISQTLVAGQQASTSPELGPLLQEVRTPVVAQENVPAPPQATPAAPKPFDDIVWFTPPAQVQNGTGVVRGVVKNGASGEGIPDVTVTLCPAQATTVRYESSDQALRGLPGFRYNGPEDRKTYFFALWDSSRCQQNGVKTDSAGRFEFKNVANGQHIVSADREGYVGGSRLDPQSSTPAYFNFNTENAYTVGAGYGRGFTFRAASFKGDRTTITANANEAAPEISLTLVRGSLSGHVRDTDGKPVENAVVRIVARSPGTASDGPTVAVALTNATGEYKVYGLQAGDYRVGAALPSGLPGSEAWFSRGTNPEAITSLRVTDGEEITNIDIVVPHR